jgi:hypothetical protein
LEEHTAYILKAEVQAKQETNKKQVPMLCLLTASSWVLA